MGHAMENKEQWEGLKKLWTWIYWIAIANGWLVMTTILLAGVNRHNTWAAGLTVFNLVLSKFWINFCEKKLEEE